MGVPIPSDLRRATVSSESNSLSAAVEHRPASSIPTFTSELDARGATSIAQDVVAKAVGDLGASGSKGISGPDGITAGTLEATKALQPIGGTQSMPPLGTLSVHPAGRPRKDRAELDPKVIAEMDAANLRMKRHREKMLSLPEDDLRRVEYLSRQSAARGAWRRSHQQRANEIHREYLARKRPPHSITSSRSTLEGLPPAQTPASRKRKSTADASSSVVSSSPLPDSSFHAYTDASPSLPMLLVKAAPQWKFNEPKFLRMSREVQPLPITKPGPTLSTSASHVPVATEGQNLRGAVTAGELFGPDKPSASTRFGTAFAKLNDFDLNVTPPNSP